MLLGATFALAGTPCSTPILAGIMSVASISTNIVIVFLFSLGQGVILIVAGLCTSLIKQFGKVAEFSEILLKVSGGFLVLASIIFYYKIFAQFFGN